MRGIVLFLVVILAFFSITMGQEPGAGYLHEKAKGLWDEDIDLENYRQGSLIIHSYTPSNCGYCLTECDFVRENYERNTERCGGHFLGLCLFNSQLDVYAYEKHSRIHSPVLTAPTTLLRYHGGYPGITAFKDSLPVHKGSIIPYEAVFDTLATALWPDDDVKLHPSSAYQLATRLIWGNNAELAVVVCADGDSACMDLNLAGLERVRKLNEERGSEYSPSYTVRFESNLSDEDLRKHLFYEGITDNFRFENLRGPHTPIQFSDGNILIGEFAFPVSQSGLHAIVPNPLNRSHYVILKLQGKNCPGRGPMPWLDYDIYGKSGDKSSEPLLYGIFAKEDTVWTYDPQSAKGTEAAKNFCKNGICPTPAIPADLSESLKRKPLPMNPPFITRTEAGRVWTIGDMACRLPSLAVDEGGTCWITWEESGDIFLESLNDSAAGAIVAIDDGSSDSYNPVMAIDGGTAWIFYLDNRTGFYRLYARSYDGRTVSPEIIMNDNEPLDAITPAVACNGQGSMALSWTEWKANERHLMWRRIDNRVPGKIKEAQILVPENKYINAWYASMVMDDDGQVHAAWNQHYPVTLGIYSGDMEHDAGAIIAGKGMGDYPSLTLAADGTLWATWESFPWDYVLEKKPQSIQAARFDASAKAWSLPYTVSQDGFALWNQTPQIASTADGRLWVVWSARREGTEPWCLYISHFENGAWSDQKMISTPDDNARAPKICAGKDNDLWIAWHSGIGDDMKIKVLHYQPQ